MYRHIPSLYYIIKQKLKGKNFLYEFYFKDKKFLDIGCGEGEFIKNDKMNGWGIDTNVRAISKLRNEGYNVKCNSAEKLEFNDEEFEAVHCHNVIEHLGSKEAYVTLKEAIRVLKSGGIFVLSTECVTKNFWNTFGHVKPYPPAAIIKLISRKESREEFESINGVEKTGLFYIGQYYKNKVLFFISVLAAYYFPIGRREYYLILKKKKHESSIFI